MEDEPEAVLPNFDERELVLYEREVAKAFHLTLEELLDEKRLKEHQFRGRPTYWTVNVSDKVSEEYWTTPELLPGEEESRGEAQLIIWGLTGFYLNLFMKLVKLW